MLCVGMILETEGLEILLVNRYEIENAYRAKWRDFEDSIQAVVAEEAKVDLIVTRNLRDFKNSPIQAMSPEKLLETLETKDK